MNYIQKWLDDNGLKMGEKFKVGGCIFKYHIGSDYDLESEEAIDDELLVEILTGGVEVIKIEPEPKTRLEKIKKNGECWTILGGNMVLHHPTGIINTNGAFATKEEAEFEAERRQLEEDMRDWQEEHDTDDRKHRYYFIRKDNHTDRLIVDWCSRECICCGDLRVRFNSEEQASKCIDVFRERIKDLYGIGVEK